MAFFKTAIIDCVAKLLGITVWINNVCYGAKPKSFSDVDVCKNQKPPKFQLIHLEHAP